MFLRRQFLHNIFQFTASNYSSKFLCFTPKNPEWKLRAILLCVFSIPYEIFTWEYFFFTVSEDVF
jgi:hypothetical protein